MKKLLKSILIATFFIAFFQTIHAQEEKTVTLTVSGTGKTPEEAKTNALRSAIEQAFGAFISSKTEILNDNLVKDEIVSVANGNIQKFDVISQVEIPNNGYAMTLNATVSISKLTSFAQSEGVSVEIKGGLFAANIIQQELNEKAELISLKNILNTSNELLKKSFDYSIETKGTPTLNNGKYDIPLKITVKLNKNFYQFRKYFINSLSGLSMSESEIANYEEIKKPIGQIIILEDINPNYNNNLSNNYIKKYYRNIESINNINAFFKGFKYIILNFNMYNNLNSLSEKEILSSDKTVINSNARIALTDKRSRRDIYIKDLIIDEKINYDERWGDFSFPEDTFTYKSWIDLALEDIYYREEICNEINEYFPNIISIFPFKKYSINMILQLSYFKNKNEIVNIDFIDTKSLEEIKELTEYKIKFKE